MGGLNLPRFGGGELGWQLSPLSLRQRGTKQKPPGWAEHGLPRLAPTEVVITMATRRPLRPCRKVGCPELVRPPEVYCPAHKHLAQQQRRERQRYYDQHVRDNRAEEFYKSRQWVAVRQQALVRDNYLCQECLKQGRITKANTVHHKASIKEDWSKRLQPDNLVSLCADCHNRLHAGESKMAWTTQVTIVCGPPGSGKTRYVREHAVRGDLILDVDALYMALSGLDWYDKPDELLPFVAEARDAVIRRLERPSEVKRAWVITTGAKKHERDALARRLRAKVVVLDVPAEECLRRIANDERRAHQLEKWHRLVDEWWREYEETESGV